MEASEIQYLLNKRVKTVKSGFKSALDTTLERFANQVVTKVEGGIIELTRLDWRKKRTKDTHQLNIDRIHSISKEIARGGEEIYTINIA